MASSLNVVIYFIDLLPHFIVDSEQGLQEDYVPPAP